jgi:hypothetical protein
LLGNRSINKSSQQYRGCVFCLVYAEELLRNKAGRLRELSEVEGPVVECETASNRRISIAKICYRETSSENNAEE